MYSPWNRATTAREINRGRNGEDSQDIPSHATNCGGEANAVQETSHDGGPRSEPAVAKPA